MPIYEYRCEKCGQSFELLRKMDDPDDTVHCPFCHSGRVEREASAFCSTGSIKSSGCGSNGKYT